MPVKKQQYSKRPVRSTRARATVSGRGAYRAKAPAQKRRQAAPRRNQGSLGRTLLTEGGSMLGGLLGSPAIGRMAGNALSNIVGLGDYEVHKNVFLEGRLPQMMNMPQGGGTVIRFQEYLSDVYTNPDIADPAGFNIQSFLINPANSNTFPWLNQIAANYEQYFIEGLIFEFRSTSADALNSTNTALGSVMMATQYDVADPVFRSKAEMLNYEFSNSTKPSDNCVHMIECAPNQSVLSGLYTLDGAAPSGTDSRLYHLGRFSIATVGFQAANVNIGELHITYQVRLLKPKLYSELGLANDYALITSSGTSAYSDAVPFSGVFAANDKNNLEITVSGGTVSLPTSSVIKTYRVEVFWQGLGGVATSNLATAITVSNGTLQSFGQAPLASASTLLVSAYFAFSTNGNSKATSFSFSSITLPTTPESCIIRIMQVPQDSFN